MSVREKTLAPKIPPSETPPPEFYPSMAEKPAPSQRAAGYFLVVVGISLMLLSGWGLEFRAVGWENVSASDPPVISGEPGGDTIVGGAGDDFIEAKDGASDLIICGSGDDVASVDELDAIAPGGARETVYRS